MSEQTSSCRARRALAPRGDRDGGGCGFNPGAHPVTDVGASDLTITQPAP